jgi:hypothetical protein
MSTDSVITIQINVKVYVQFRQLYIYHTDTLPSTITANLSTLSLEHCSSSLILLLELSTTYFE